MGIAQLLKTLGVDLKKHAGRDIIVKFSGCYHGHADPFLVKAGSGMATFNIQTVPGVPAGVYGDTLTAPYNDLDVVAGQGTIGVELQRQLPQPGAVFAAVGGGGLIGGIGEYLKAVSPQTEIVGCWPLNSPVMHHCLRAGSIVDVAEQPTLSESTAGGLEPGSVTFDICRRVIDRSVLVSEDEILRAMRLILEIEHWVIEGAAAVAVAAFLKEASRWRGRNVIILICGRNLSPEVLHRLSWSDRVAT